METEAFENRQSTQDNIFFQIPYMKTTLRKSKLLLLLLTIALGRDFNNSQNVYLFQSKLKWPLDEEKAAVMMNCFFVFAK